MEVAAGILGGLVVGEIIRRWLNQLKYRVTWEDNDEMDLPQPGSRWWVPLALGICWGCAMWLIPPTYSLSSWAHVLGWMAFSAIGAWMAAVDMDVRRLPDAAQLLLAGTTILAGVVFAGSDPIRLLMGLTTGLVCGVAFLAIHMLTRGDLGLGDVKLVMICGWWLGLISPTAVFAGLFVGCLLAVLYSALARVRQFAFGPWLVAGTIIAGLVLPAHR